MSCILRVYGIDLDVDVLLSETHLQSDKVWRKGEPRLLGKVHSDSGASFVASIADLKQFDLQVKETTAFLERHSETIARMAEFPGVEGG